MPLAWSFSLILFFIGLSLEAAALLLLLTVLRMGDDRLASATRLSAAFLVPALALQVAALFVPPIPISSLWFVLGAIPLLLPAPLLALTLRRAGRAGPHARSEATWEEYHQHLTRIPDVLASHPEGLTLVEIGKEIGTEWRRLTRAAKELLDRGDLRKVGKRYFTTSRTITSGERDRS